MSNLARPVLLGYIRAEVLRSPSDLPGVEAELEAFAEREEFCLGTVYVARDSTPGPFHALMAEMNRDESTWGVVVPDLRHVTHDDYLLMRRHQRDCARGAILVASFSPCSGRPGAVSPVRRQVCHSTPSR